MRTTAGDAGGKEPERFLIRNMPEIKQIRQKRDSRAHHPEMESFKVNITSLARPILGRPLTCEAHRALDQTRSLG
jgi:hypothetical protein